MPACKTKAKMNKGDLYLPPEAYKCPECNRRTKTPFWCGKCGASWSVVTLVDWPLFFTHMIDEVPSIFFYSVWIDHYSLPIW